MPGERWERELRLPIRNVQRRQFAVWTWGRRTEMREQWRMLNVGFGKIVRRIRVRRDGLQHDLYEYR